MQTIYFPQVFYDVNRTLNLFLNTRKKITGSTGNTDTWNTPVLEIPNKNPCTWTMYYCPTLIVEVSINSVLKFGVIVHRVVISVEIPNLHLIFLNTEWTYIDNSKIDFLQWHWAIFCNIPKYWFCNGSYFKTISLKKKFLRTCFTDNFIFCNFILNCFHPKTNQKRVIRKKINFRDLFSILQNASCRKLKMLFEPA